MQYLARIEQRRHCKKKDCLSFLQKIHIFHDKPLLPLVESTQDLIELNLSQNIQTLKDLRFFAKRFFNLVNEKIS